MPSMITNVADEHRHQVERGAFVGRDRQAEDGHQRQAHRGRDQRAGQGPDGQRVVGAEAPEPAEAVDRRHGVPDGQRVGDRLRRERQLDQRARRGPQVARPEQLVLHGGEGGRRSRSRRRSPARTHHQSKCLKTVEKPSSSEVFDERTHRATATRPKPTANADERPGPAQEPSHRRPPGRLRLRPPLPRLPADRRCRRSRSRPSRCVRARPHRGGAGACGGTGPLGRGAIRARRR